MRYFVFLLMLAGCSHTVCTEDVEKSTSGALGMATISHCGIGHCVEVGKGTYLRFRLPTETGETTLDELGAEVCVGDDDHCAPAVGTMTVRETHPPAPGQPVGRLDVDIEITSETMRGHATIDYREELATSCREVSDFGDFPVGPE